MCKATRESSETSKQTGESELVQAYCACTTRAISDKRFRPSTTSSIIASSAASSGSASNSGSLLGWGEADLWLVSAGKQPDEDTLSKTGGSRIVLFC
mmetsp:Transcript_122669/g.192521  ORF Transcript_122669/g.192521 Transcript_122669/m.192521 type:complete len:97 (+) Transcript_122669:21-311(+)